MPLWYPYLVKRFQHSRPQVSYLEFFQVVLVPRDRLVASDVKDLSDAIPPGRDAGQDASAAPVIQRRSLGERTGKRMNLE